ncbi:MAG: zinc ribbon domain-containing protein [Planctomycetes bacterium]|nr:zinc ribbon domain-containing protein [Planctomycetota bacterium]
MPIFEYKCKNCGAVSEFLVPAGRNPKHPCQKCGSKDTEKMFSSFAVGLRHDGTDSKCFGCSDGGCPHAK